MDRDSLHTFCTEGQAFEARHREDLPAEQRAWGAVVWGFLRDLAECPTCPGVFRTSPDGWETLICPQCKGVWSKAPEAPEPPPPRTKAARRPRRRQG
jgi:hypothetical protein